MAVLSNLDLLRRVPVFSELTSFQMAQLADAVTKRRFKRGERIVEQGKWSEALFIILAGRARVLLADRRGREVILDVLGPMSNATCWCSAKLTSTVAWTVITPWRNP